MEERTRRNIESQNAWKKQKGITQWVLTKK
jgi:hypothetical protein